MFQLIVSQGRLADRKNRTIEGAKLTAHMLEMKLGIKGRYIGTPSPIVSDDWTASLPQAHDTLVGLAEGISTCIAQGKTPIMAANTCSASLASLPVMAKAHPDAVLLWVDAHGDFNTPETTGSGYLGGMVLAAACGLWDSTHGQGLDPKRIVLVGARDIDPAERKLLTRAGVRILSPEEATPAAICAAVGAAPVWVHVDWDVMEPGFIPADYAVPNGFTPDNLRAIFEALPADALVGLELAEFHAPDLVVDSKAPLALIQQIIEPLLQSEMAL